MKKTLIYIAAAVLGVTALSSCDDDFTRPPLVLPETLTIEPTMTTDAFKTQYWSTIQSGPAAIGMTEAGDSIILTGRVCSSDESGNIYKNIVVQSHDAEGNQIALSFSVNRNDIYELFPFGQEVAIYATGLNIGPYRKLLQFGSVNGDQMTFMDEAIFTVHVFRNKYALPEPEKVDTTIATLKEIVAAKSNDKDLMMWQSRLVRVNGVSFVDAGQQFAGKQTSDRYVTDAEGNRLNVRNSSYSDFSDAILPYGTGSVVGILSYYQSDWQLLLIDKEGCIDFDGVAPEPGPDDSKPSGEGTAESPYNTVKALEVANALGADETTATEYYVEGVVSSIKEINPSFGNGTYSITSEGTNVAFDIFRSYYLDGAKFTSEDQLKVGDKVVVCGKLVNFKGNTPQMAQGGKIVSLNGQGGGDEPVTPPTENNLYSFLDASLTELPSDWTIENVELGSASYVWQWKIYNDKGYLNASAYVNNTAIATEAYAISPVIDLSGASECTASFEHAAKFQTTLRTLCGLVVREEGNTEWTPIAIPTWPEAGSWTFVSSGSIDLAAYDGKKIQLAFKYGSSADGADTWEIKNLAINGKK